MISVVVISKNEPALEHTLAALLRVRTQLHDEPLPDGTDEMEILVVDASAGQIDYLRSSDEIHWIPFQAPPNVRVSIPHQRDEGVRAAKGDVIVFTDAGCEPGDGWLRALVEPIVTGRERIVTGIALAIGENNLYDAAQHESTASYVEECATINLAFERSVFDEVDGFDERFQYGSDVDFSWRVRDAGIRIARQPNAIVRHDWGGARRQIKRSYMYGKARARLYRKHSPRRRLALKQDPIAVAYPLFLLGLPLTLVWPAYPALLLIPAYRNRKNGALRVVVDHLAYGLGILSEALGA
jgi:glycosyltransferase involved in cell wall biosynthesis